MKYFLVWVYTVKALLFFINKAFEFMFVCFSLIYEWKQEDNTRHMKDSAYERGGDPRQKFWMEHLKETDLGVPQAFFDP